jgi:saccharopine dehydrogenase-like NADP-dependent oxidoreductase
MPDTVAVLIGTGSIGIAVARRAAVSHTLLLADYNEAQLGAVADQLQGEGYDVETRVVNVSDRASVAALAAAATSLGEVVRVIHAAASRRPRPRRSGSCTSTSSGPHTCSTRSPM